MIQKSDIYSRLTFNRLTYTQSRKAHKLSLLAAFFVLFKSTVGLGLFSYPYVFSQVGIGYGVIFGSLICYITLYGMYCLANLSNLIEAESVTTKFNSYDGRLLFKLELVSHLAEKALGPKWDKFLSTLTIVSCVIINGSVIIGAIIEIG